MKIIGYVNDEIPIYSYKGYTIFYTPRRETIKGYDLPSYQITYKRDGYFHNIANCMNPPRSLKSVKYLIDNKLDLKLIRWPIGTSSRVQWVVSCDCNINRFNPVTDKCFNSRERALNYMLYNAKLY